MALKKQRQHKPALIAKACRSRARRDANREFRSARKNRRLASLLPRWCPDEGAGE
jgi:hypothetical protein